MSDRETCRTAGRVENKRMHDVQSGPASVALAIDRVGVKEVDFPISVQDRTNDHQHTVASVDMGADLPAAFKGTHMSRFVEALEAWSGVLNYANVKSLLSDILERLDARKAYVSFAFPFFQQKSAPMSGSKGMLAYPCRMTGELRQGESRPVFNLAVDVPVMTVCPCSLAICDEGAHSQRAIIKMNCRMQGLLWIEDLIEIGEAASSSPVYTLLKREDEKQVTEQAFANPAFVEDVVRTVAQSLEAHPNVTWYSVVVESQESIHNHNAYAGIEKAKD